MVDVAKLLVKELDKVAFRENDSEVRVGAAFLLCAHQLCQVYKVYCSNHNVIAEPLLKKVSVYACVCPLLSSKWIYI